MVIRIAKQVARDRGAAPKGYRVYPEKRQRRDRASCKARRVDTSEPWGEGLRVRAAACDETAVTWTRLHRWLAIVLVVPLVAWLVTGLLFHLKPGWDRAYDLLSVKQVGVALPTETLPPLRVSQLTTGPVWRTELIPTVLGPLYRVDAADGPLIVDATTGARRSPLTEEDARALITDATSRSRHREAYGPLLELSVDDRVARARFAHGIVVELGRSDASLSQRGADTDRIDWLYRIHYLQWTGHRPFDRALAIAGLALIAAVIVPGLVLFVRRWRGQKPRAARSSAIC